ncbi:MAG: beta-galactosidase [Kiritimatiellae bacterium]|nr:beta-galactosidase [Kiritimatiellia bacterium]
MMRKLSIFCITAGVALVSAAAPRSMKIWPSELCAVRAHSKSSCIIDDREQIHVTTGVGYSWPGVTVYFKSKSFDLSAQRTLNVVVSNSCARSLNINLSVKNQPDKGSSPGGSISLKPGECGTLSVALLKRPWALDKPLELVGMNGYPEAIDTALFDLRKTAELHVFLDNPDQPASLSVLGIEAEQSTEELKVFSADSFIPFVDKFGQFKHDDWPGKIHSEKELSEAREREAEYLAAAKAPSGFNKWGGWAEGPRLAATGHFRTQKVRGVWWLVDPDGCLFFSHGVDCVNLGSDTGIAYREPYFEWLPEDDSPFAEAYGWNSWAPHGFYKDRGRHRTFNFAKANMQRKYGAGWKELYKEMAHQRIHAWGLNTIANWSDKDVYTMQRTPYVVSLGTAAPPIKGSSGWWGKFPDPFYPAFRESIEQRISRQKDTVNDPWCIGYFVDNELSWGGNDSALSEAALNSPATQPAKVALRQWLEKNYESIENLNQSWQTKHSSWEAFLESHEIPESATGKTDLLKLHELVAAQYFQIIKEVLKESAPDKLYLGCRFAAGSPASYRVASRYCDVVSFNNYTRAVKKDIPEGSEDKPLINGEFHFGALDRGVFHTGLVPVKSQQERAQAYQAFVTSCLKHPRYVGTHWFQWKDQPLTGRGDGENYQIGFLTVTDQPYPELVEAARKIGETMYSVRMQCSE